VAAIHPFGKMPVMRHGDFEPCGSQAITTYLDPTVPGRNRSRPAQDPNGLMTTLTSIRAMPR
jgi:glutathione S-transferase